MSKIFQGRSTLELAETHKGGIVEDIQRAPLSRLDGTDQECAAAFAEPYLLPNNVSINYDNITYDDCEVEVPTNDFGRSINVRRQQFRFYLPFTGDDQFFYIRPSSGPMWYPRSVSVEGSTLVFTYVDDGSGAEGIKRQFDSDLRVIRESVENHRAALAQQNEILQRFSVSIIAQRRAQLQAQQATADRMGFPRRQP